MSSSPDLLPSPTRSLSPNRRNAIRRLTFDLSKVIKEEKFSDSSDSSEISSSMQDESSEELPIEQIRLPTFEKQPTKGDIKLDTINKAFRDLVHKLRQKNSEDAKLGQMENDQANFIQLKNLFDIDFAVSLSSGPTLNSNFRGNLTYTDISTTRRFRHRKPIPKNCSSAVLI